MDTVRKPLRWSRKAIVFACAWAVAGAIFASSSHAQVGLDTTANAQSNGNSNSLAAGITVAANSGRMLVAVLVMQDNSNDAGSDIADAAINVADSVNGAFTRVVENLNGTNAYTSTAAACLGTRAGNRAAEIFVLNPAGGVSTGAHTVTANMTSGNGIQIKRLSVYSIYNVVNGTTSFTTGAQNPGASPTTLNLGVGTAGSMVISGIVMGSNNTISTTAAGAVSSIVNSIGGIGNTACFTALQASVGQFYALNVAAGTYNATWTMSGSNLNRSAYAAIVIPPAPPVASLSTPSLSFANRDVDAGVSATQNVTVTNTGGSQLAITNIDLTGADAASFTENGVAINLNPGANTVVAVGFDPALPIGAKSANLRVQSNDPVTPNALVSLSGTALDQEISGSPGSATYGSQDVDAGQTAAQTFTITNNGNATLNISSVSLVGANAGDFVITADSGEAALAPAGSRTIDVAFDPTATGNLSAALRVLSDDTDEATTDLSLAGTGIDQEISLNTLIHAYNDTDIDAGATPSFTYIITNAGSNTLNISSVSLGGANPGDYTITGDSGQASLAPAAVRSVDVAFDPTALGARPAALVIDSDDTDEPSVSVNLLGNGIDQQIDVAPLSADYGSKDVDDSTPTPQTISINNIGTADLTITSVNIIGADASSFAIVFDSGTSVITTDPPTSRTLQLDFFPVSPGAKSASLEIVSDDSNNSPTVLVALTGVGIDQEIDVAPSSLSFGSQGTILGATASQNVVIANTGSNTLSLSSVSLGGTDPGEFTITGDTGEASLAPTGTRTVSVAFDPNTAGVKSAALVVNSDDTSEPNVAVGLSGTGVAPTPTPSPSPSGPSPTPSLSPSPTPSPTPNAASDWEIYG